MNLLTLLAPWLFGGDASTYWGKWYLWEMTLFIGAAGLLLAIIGIARGRLTSRRAAAVTLAVTLVLAMGGYTPVFELLYRLPIFNMLRGLSKFIFPASLFLGLFAGAGLDAVLSLRRRWLGVRCPRRRWPWRPSAWPAGFTSSPPRVRARPGTIRSTACAAPLAPFRRS